MQNLLLYLQYLYDLHVSSSFELKQLFALFGSREYPICFGSSIRPIFETPTHASTALINNLLIVFFEFLAVDPKGRPLLVVDLKGRPIVSVDVGDAGFSKVDPLGRPLLAVDFGEAVRSAVDVTSNIQTTEDWFYDHFMDPVICGISINATYVISDFFEAMDIIGNIFGKELCCGTVC